MKNSAWYYDEFKQVGTDYDSIEEVRIYDERMHKLRNIPKEVSDTLAIMGIGPDDSLLEYGCGTCELGITAAGLCRKVYAVDISQVMINYASAKAKSRGVDNIEFHRAGFLTYEHKGEPVDFVVTQLAFHHLPDFWKAVALGKIRDNLKTGGKLLIRDVVFSFDMSKYKEALDAWVDGVAKTAGKDNAVSCENHIRDEYSTTSWLMEEMLKKTGFDIIRADYSDGVFAVYLCKKK